MCGYPSPLDHATARLYWQLTTQVVPTVTRPCLVRITILELLPSSAFQEEQVPITLMSGGHSDIATHLSSETAIERIPLGHPLVFNFLSSNSFKAAGRFIAVALGTPHLVGRYVRVIPRFIARVQGIFEFRIDRQDVAGAT